MKEKETIKIKNPNAPATSAQLERIRWDMHLNCYAIELLTKQQASNLISFYYNVMQRHPFDEHWGIGDNLHKCLCLEGVDKLMELIKLPYKEVKNYDYKITREY